MVPVDGLEVEAAELVLEVEAAELVWTLMFPLLGLLFMSLQGMPNTSQ